MVVATNPFALILVLPSLHAWLWLPQVQSRPVWLRAAVLALGFLGPLVLLISFATRYGLGLDAPWYLAELVAVHYVTIPTFAIWMAWLAAAAQLSALAHAGTRRIPTQPTAASARFERDFGASTSAQRARHRASEQRQRATGA
jgi:hypothetical protein